MKGRSKYPDAYKWQCTRCQTWNNIENGICSGCNKMPQQAAGAFRLQNVLTPEELNTHTGTLPMVLRELQTIRKLIERLLSK